MYDTPAVAVKIQSLLSNGRGGQNKRPERGVEGVPDGFSARRNALLMAISPEGHRKVRSELRCGVSLRILPQFLLKALLGLYMIGGCTQPYPFYQFPGQSGNQVPGILVHSADQHMTILVQDCLQTTFCSVAEQSTPMVFFLVILPTCQFYNRSGFRCVHPPHKLLRSLSGILRTEVSAVPAKRPVETDCGRCKCHIRQNLHKIRRSLFQRKLPCPACFIQSPKCLKVLQRGVRC